MAARLWLTAVVAAVLFLGHLRRHGHPQPRRCSAILGLSASAALALLLVGYCLMRTRRLGFLDDLADTGLVRPASSPSSSRGDGLQPEPGLEIDDRERRLDALHPADHDDVNAGPAAGGALLSGLELFRVPQTCGDEIGRIGALI